MMKGLIAAAFAFTIGSDPAAMAQARDFSRWHALWASRGTPRDVIAKLNGAIVAALADPMVRSRLADLGQNIFPREQQTPAALGTYHKAEIEK